MKKICIYLMMGIISGILLYLSKEFIDWWVFLIIMVYFIINIKILLI